VAQINKGKLKELGLGVFGTGLDRGNVDFTAPGLLGQLEDGDVSPGGITGAFELGDLNPQIAVTHFPSGISAILKALAGKDLAKVLAKPNLVVRTGETGEFLAGSRIPIPHLGADGVPTITYEEVGIKLKFQPEVLENGTIRLKIDPAEVSSVAAFRVFAGGTAPQIDTREVRTSVDLKENESLILAGLLSEEMKKNIQKVPLLGDIPILGALFRSTREELETTELAFFITPRLVKPNAPGEEPELPGEAPLTRAEEKEFEWIPVPWGGKSTKEAEPAEEE
jgi:pilus assembly protein CpaC